MNRTKPFFTSSLKDIIYVTRRKASNHYDTLNISKDSTQEQIKAAYYDLTKKYHPDRNTTQDAKTKFQDVSNAYEVLGNFHKRKLYDRDLMARGTAAGKNTSYTVPNDKLSGFYRSRTANVNANHSMDNFRNYDFDAWTREHYGKVLKNQLNKKILYEDWTKQREKRHAEDVAEFRTSMRFALFALSVIISAVTLQSITISSYDEPVIKSKSKD